MSVRPRLTHRSLALAAIAAVAASTLAPAAQADHGRPDHSRTWLLTGDDDAAAGSKFEGIGVDERRGLFYVSETTGGEIHRGHVGTRKTTEWLAGDGTDGRYTARGVTTDAAGNVYIAGGPNGLGTGRPDLWVHDRQGNLLAALRAPGTDTFLNDVTIGPDGAAYFTDSNTARIIKVSQHRGSWRAEVFADASATVERATGFNLGGIVVSRDRRALVVAQGNVGKLWRVDLRSGRTTEVRTHGADLVNADGLVLRGSHLTVVRNFSRMIATGRLSADGRELRGVIQRASDPERVLTTAKWLRGTMMYVDSKFDEPIASGPYEVLASPFGQRR